MIAEFFRIGVGSLLMLVFLVLLLALVSNHSIRDEPRGKLVITLTLLGLTCGCALLTVAAADMATDEATPLPLCYSVLSFGIGAIIAFKLTALFLAVDQYVAVVRCLRYYTIMDVQVPRMVAIVCACVLFFGIFGLACFFFGMENTADFHQRVFGVQRNLTQCSWEKMSGVYMLSGEIILLALALAVCVLACYTAAVGLKQQRRVTQDEELTPQTQRFITNFKSFKRIVKVLLVLLAFDILGCVVRIVSRWFPQSTVATLFQLVRFIGLVIECWTYGLGHATVRTELQKYLRRRCGTVPGVPAPRCRPPELPTITQA